VSDVPEFYLAPGEVAALNAARNALDRIAARALYDHKTQASGMLYVAAQDCEHTLFRVLNIAKSYAHVPITNDELHNRARVA
jgi:hypothetical protein